MSYTPKMSCQIEILSEVEEVEVEFEVVSIVLNVRDDGTVDGVYGPDYYYGDGSSPNKPSRNKYQLYLNEDGTVSGYAYGGIPMVQKNLPVLLTLDKGKVTGDWFKDDVRIYEVFRTKEMKPIEFYTDKEGIVIGNWF